MKKVSNNNMPSIKSWPYMSSTGMLYTLSIGLDLDLPLYKEVDRDLFLKAIGAKEALYLNGLNWVGWLETR